MISIKLLRIFFIFIVFTIYNGCGEKFKHPGNVDVIECPSNYILVPADTELGVSAFCVMKYEAKAQAVTAGVYGGVDAVGGTVANWASIYHSNNNTTGYRPVSQENGNPWRYINEVDAKQACLNIGAGYDLITNTEWMTIARNVERQAANWSNNAVGDGCLYRGNSGLNDDCGYDGANPESGAGRNAKAKLILSNGEEIWDFAGNVWELVDWSHPKVSGTTGASFLVGPTTCTGSAIEINTVACAELADDDYTPGNPAIPPVPTGTYGSSFGLGQFWAHAGGTSRRGGGWTNGVGAGVFALNLNNPQGFTNMLGGFRCVKRP